MDSRDEEKAPLLSGAAASSGGDLGGVNEVAAASLGVRIWVESKKLWHIVGPATFSRVTMYGMNIVTQAFAGHLGDLELAAFSVANTVILGFAYGLIVIYAYTSQSHLSPLRIVNILVSSTIYT